MVGTEGMSLRICAERVGASEASLRNWLRAGHFKACGEDFSGRPVFDPEQIRAAMAEHGLGRRKSEGGGEAPEADDEGERPTPASECALEQDEDEQVAAIEHEARNAAFQAAEDVVMAAIVRAKKNRVLRRKLLAVLMDLQNHMDPEAEADAPGDESEE